MIEAIDSYYRHVKSRIIALNPKRTVVGVIEAQDWPPKEIQFGAFYLLTLADTPLGWNPTAQNMMTLTQWVWAISGDDLREDQRGRNRGNKYRTNWTMKRELMYGLFPYFTEKKIHDAVQSGNSIVVESTSYSKKEMVSWAAPRFMPTSFVESTGILYGAAQVGVQYFTDEITS